MLPPVAGYEAWYRADNIGAVLNDGDPITTLDNNEGTSSRDLGSSGTARPLYKTNILKDLPVMRFDGSNDLLFAVANYMNGQSGSVFAVVKPAVVNKVQVIFAGVQNGATNNRALLYLSQDVVAIFVNANGSGRVIGTSAGAVSAGNTYIIEFHSNGSAYDIRINGVSQALTIYSGSNDGAWFGDLTSQNLTELGFWTDNSTNKDFWNGDIAEVIAYDDVTLTTDQKNDVYRYLRGKWFGGISSANPLYPVNSTTIDTGTGIDIRFLADAEVGATENSGCSFTHTQDNVERTYDPATTGVTNTNNAGTTLFKMGWGLRLVEDMTPDDDINCNAVLTPGTVEVSIALNPNQSGGTYAGGTFNPTVRASLWRYNPATDTGTLIGAGSTTGTSWTAGGLGDDLGTTKAAIVNIDITENTEFLDGEILLLQVGFNTGTVPNPTLGTANWTMTFHTDISASKITWDTGQGLAALCFLTGTSSGSASASGVLAPVFPTTGTSAGVATASGSLEADKETTGTSAGVATVSGSLEAEKETTGTSAGQATASGVPAVVVPTVGTSEVGAGGDTIVKKPIYIFED